MKAFSFASGILALGAASLAAETPFEIADRAATGSVTVINRPWTFEAGKIDWLFDPTKLKGPRNAEWTWQLNRMYFWPEMAKAYRATKDEKYARAFAAQLEGWLDQTGGAPAEEHFNAVGSPWRTIEEGIRLMSTWPAAWEAFKDSPSFPELLKRRFAESMRAQAGHLMRHRSDGGNWLLMEMNGVYTFSSLFPQFPACAVWRKESAKIFSEAVRNQILPDGLHDELSPDYHSVVTWCAMPLYETARKYGTESDLPADYLDTLRLCAEGPIAMTTPAFVQPRFNDCYTIPLKGILRGQERYFPDRKDFLWAATEGREGEPPKGVTASRFLPWSGFAVMRSGWDRDATYLCFDVGPLGASFFHAHQDKLSFTLHKGAEELVFEDGGGPYEDSDARRYGVSGYDHNTLLVDGLAQFRREPLRVRKPIDALWTTTSARDVAFGVYDQGFGPDERKLVLHTRKITFDKQADAFTLEDVVTSADRQEHSCQLLFQLPTTNTVVSADGRTLRARYGRTWDLELVAAKGGTVTAVSAQLRPRMAGWFVGRNDRRIEPATTVFVTAPKALAAYFVTILRPVPSSKGK